MATKRVVDARQHTHKVRALTGEAKGQLLQPIEKKLIGWSIGLGVGVLGILLWVSYTFPAGH